MFGTVGGLGSVKRIKILWGAGEGVANRLNMVKFVLRPP